MALVITLKRDEPVQIGDNITIRTKIYNSQIRIQIEAPKEIKILRPWKLEKDKLKKESQQ